MKKPLFTFFVIALCTLSSHDTYGSQNNSFFTQLLTPRPKKSDVRLQLAGLELNLSQVGNIAFTVGSTSLALMYLASLKNVHQNWDKIIIPSILALSFSARAAYALSVNMFFAYRTINTEQLFPICFVKDEDKENTLAITENHN